ncbi:hypothetical protein EC957_006767 [Mortierella hygrophila]|uniref:Uncharacterized protein n=1 Tax=Mortierella hygrophila TaxID=979708 RepID=A0A9P6JYX8_9FUNG|nr:hypothetical protein EC957_006767 [Mortierella hygrophila]
MDDEPKTQPFINSVTSLIVYVAVVRHPASHQHIVLWDDILSAFPDVANLTIKNGIAAVPFVKDTSFEKTYIEQVDFERRNYAQSDIFSEVPSVKPHDRFLDLLVEGEMESGQDIEEVDIEMGRIELGGSSAIEYYQSSSGGRDRIATALPAITSPSSDDHINGNGIDRNITPPLSTTSSTESGTGSGVSTSSAANIPPSNIDTADSGASVVSGAAAVPDPTEIDPMEATSSWASIFRTLGDLQAQYHLTPEETIIMFTEISQST